MSESLHHRPVAVQHVYQKSVSGEIIFYSARDAIVFFTLFCVCARKHGLHPTALCLMPEHIHGLYPVGSRLLLSPFIQETTHRFSAEFNKDARRKAPLFKHQFGSAMKYGDKQIRSINAYVANNPVEKKSCLRAEQYKWNFLAYAESDHPFSEKLIVRKTSCRMRKAIKVIKDMSMRDLPFNYTLFDRICEGLAAQERLQLTDLIISAYNVLDYDTLLSYYKSYEGMLEAFANTKGAEYDLKEDFDKYSNRNYARIGDFLKERVGISRPKEVLWLPEEQRITLLRQVVADCVAPEYQARKYLHLF